MSLVPRKAPLVGLAPVLPLVAQKPVDDTPFRVVAFTFEMVEPLPTNEPEKLLPALLNVSALP